VPKIEAKEPFTTASAHTAVRNGFCIRLGQPWDAKVPKYTAKNGTAWCRWAWLGLAGRGLARPGMLLSLKDAKENPDHHRRPSTGGLLFCPLESPGASPRCLPWALPGCQNAEIRALARGNGLFRGLFGNCVATTRLSYRVATDTEAAGVKTDFPVRDSNDETPNETPM